MTPIEQEKNEEINRENLPQGALLNEQLQGERDPSNPGASPAMESIPEIAESSKIFYGKIVRLLTKYSTEKRSSDILEPVAVAPKDIVEDLFERKDIQGKTFRIYKSAMIWYLRSNIADKNFSEAYLTLRRLEIKKKSREATVQSAQTKRRQTLVIPKSDYNTLLEELAASASKASGKRYTWSYRAQYFLMAVLATGVRPTEWQSAEWVDPDKTTLRVVSTKKKVSDPAFMRKTDFVQNQEGGVNLIADAKGPGALDEATNASPDDQEQISQAADQDEAAYDEEDLGIRDILVDGKDQFNVDHHMQLIREHLAEGNDYFSYFNSTRVAIYRACRKIWNGRKQYTLETMRSQFSANKKASIGAADTAPLMGHSSPHSPGTGYYGKANQAHRAYRKAPKADSEMLNQGFDIQKQEQSTLADAMIPWRTSKF